jgi:hypothetical protein
MLTILNRWAMLVSIGLITTVSAAACSAHPAGNIAGPAGPAATTPAATASQAVSPGGATPSATHGAAAVQNLVVTSSVSDELQAAYVAYKQFPPSDIAGAAPNSVYYAYDPATDTYWAMATFEPSATASVNTETAMQDGGNTGMFTKASDGAWQMRQASFPPGCDLAQFFPSAVIAAWALSTFCPPGHS